MQSFDARHLHALGRIHDADEARRAAEAAMTIFGNVNLDLMFALPGQTLADCEADVAAALSFGTPHLSFYQLTLEPNTCSTAIRPPGCPTTTSPPTCRSSSRSGSRAPASSATRCRPTRAAVRDCAHNVNYWRFGDYLGSGPAHMPKMSLPDRIVREIRHRHPRQYVEQVAAAAGGHRAARGRRARRSGSSSC